MTSTMKGSLVLVALLAVPAVASAQGGRFDGWRTRAEIRREVRDALREARRTRWEAVRWIRRDAMRVRAEVRRATREAVRDARRAARDARRFWLK